MRLPLLCLLTAVLLTGCVSARAPVGAAAALALTPDGLGPVRIGMSKAEVEAALGRRFAPAPDGDIGMEGCELYALEEAGPTYMFEAGRLTRISVDGPGAPRTQAGAGVGDAEARVLALHPEAIRTPHTYADPPAAYLTVWDKVRERGYNFETDETGVVRMLHAGRASIVYVEGCL